MRCSCARVPVAIHTPLSSLPRSIERRRHGLLERRCALPRSWFVRGLRYSWHKMQLLHSQGCHRQLRLWLRFRLPVHLLMIRFTASVSSRYPPPDAQLLPTSLISLRSRMVGIGRMGWDATLSCFLASAVHSADTARRLVCSSGT